MAEAKKKSTIATIAEELGVSPSTVSRAFNPESKISDEVRQKILRCAKQQNYVPNLAASRLSMREINIVVLFTNAYQHAAEEYRRGVTDAYRELFDLKINLEIKILDEKDKKPENLKPLLNECSSFDGVIVSGFLEEEELRELNRLAKKTNLVLLQADMPQIDRLFASCHDSGVSSRLAAEFLGDCLRRSARRNVVIFTGDRKSDLHRRANEFFLEAAEAFGLTVIDSFDMQDSPEILKWQLHEMHTKRGVWPDGIYITSGRSLELCKYMKANDLADRTVLVTFDVHKETVDYLKQGIIWGSIYQNLYKQAKNAFTHLVRYLIGEVEPDSVISPVPELILKSNLDFYIS